LPLCHKTRWNKQEYGIEWIISSSNAALVGKTIDKMTYIIYCIHTQTMPLRKHFYCMKYSYLSLKNHIILHILTPLELFAVSSAVSKGILRKVMLNKALSEAA
jgi:hypothetical protein